MSGELSHITRCLDLHEPDIVRAIGTREGTRALLVHLASISAPDTGVAKALLVLARMATTACAWIDGDLTIELLARGDDAEGGGETAIETATDLGGGLRERLLPTLVFKAPLAEFTRAIERVPHLIAPLTLRGGHAKGGGKGKGSTGGKRVTLSATSGVRRTTLPPPPIEVAAESLIVRAPAPPALRTTAGSRVRGSGQGRVQGDAERSPPPLPVVAAAPRPPPAPAPRQPPPPSGAPPGPEDAERGPEPDPQGERRERDVDSGWDD